MADADLARITQWGAVRAAPADAALRRHIYLRDWGTAIGTDYWFNPSGELTTAGAASDILSDHGWITTSLVETAGAGGDFGSSADVGAPAHLLTNASGDLLQSPAVFGDYAHMYGASKFLGYMPTQMHCEFFGAMTVHTADEVTSGWGLTEDGGSIATAADNIAFISTDGTNFQISGNAATPVNGAADDALWHRFKLVLDKNTGLVTWEIDGASQAMATSLAITADEFPCSFGFHALTTNRPGLGQVHIWYE